MKYLLIIITLSILAQANQQYKEIIGYMETPSILSMIKDKDNTYSFKLNGDISIKNKDSIDLCQVMESSDLICTTYKMRTVIISKESNSFVIKNNRIKFVTNYIPMFLVNYKKFLKKKF